MTVAREYRDRLLERSTELRAWLDRNGADCHTIQLHTKAGTSERVYWHYGYLIAIEDMLRLLDYLVATTSDSHKLDMEP